MRLEDGSTGEELHRQRLPFCMDSSNVFIAKTSSVTAGF